MAISFSKMGNGDCIVAHHAVTDNKLGLGNPIDPIKAAKLIDELVERDGIKSGWIDSRVIFENDLSLVWYRQADAEPTTMWFRINDKPPIEVKARLPTLIFIRQKHSSSTSVFACAGNKRPDATSNIYHAPLLNTGPQGSFCLGSATVPIGLTENINMIIGTEDAIFNSLFTHTNQPFTFSARHGKNISSSEHIKIWKSFSKRNARPTKADLTSMNCNLAKIISGV